MRSQALGRERVIVIDTHIWTWAAQDIAQLSKPQQQALEQAADGVLLSAISIWEAAMLIHRGRLETILKPIDWINSALTLGPLSVVELTPPIVCESMSLTDPFPKDPADRIIAATAIVTDLPLVTSDKRIIEYRDITTIA